MSLITIKDRTQGDIRKQNAGPSVVTVVVGGGERETRLQRAWSIVLCGLVSDEAPPTRGMCARATGRCGVNASSRKMKTTGRARYVASSVMFAS